MYKWKSDHLIAVKGPELKELEKISLRIYVAVIMTITNTLNSASDFCLAQPIHCDWLQPFMSKLFRKSNEITSGWVITFDTLYN